jgi:hypothetical protein
MRVKKLESASAWSENPPSRSRHMVSNVRITDVTGDEITVEACFHLYRTRLNSEVDSWVGRRTDVLRRADGQLSPRPTPHLPRPDGDPGDQHEHDLLRSGAIWTVARQP